jgi:hypothetical protein
MNRSTVVKILTRIVVAGGAVLAGLYVVFYFLQTGLIFQGESVLTSHPSVHGWAHEDVELLVDGETTHGWYIPLENDRGTVLLSHGNGGNISTRLGRVRMLRSLGFSVLLYDYGGYGQSTGKPSERRVYADVQAMWDYLVDDKQIPPERIVLFGPSFGSGASCEMATRVRPAAVVIESGFSSMAKAAFKDYPWFPGGLFLRHRFENAYKMGTIQAPVLVIHSVDDELYPIEHGRALYQNANEPKSLVEIQGDHYNAPTISEGSYVQAWREFMDPILTWSGGEKKASSEMTISSQVIDQFVILVHPCPYEGMKKPEDDPYRVAERAAAERWFAAIPSLSPTTFVVQVDFAVEGPSPDRLHQAFVERVGAERVCRVACEVQSPEEPGALKEYYARIDAQVMRQIMENGFSFDPMIISTIIWGQSFEGCAAGFGTSIATGLGLKTPTEMDYAMSAPDAPFLLDATFLKVEAVPDSDVEAYVFALEDGRHAAFFRSTLTPQWLDTRAIELSLDLERFSVLTKQGDRVWPDVEAPTPEQLADSRYNQWRTIDWPEPLRPGDFTLSTIQERFVIAEPPYRGELLAVIQTATVRE